jgi:hypothetical protein
MVRLSSLLAAAALLVAPVPALAWGQTGHRVTGAIADRYLSADARKAITGILGRETLAEASTWADFMRADQSEFWQRLASPWHYVTVPNGIYSEANAPAEGDAFTALQRFSATLRNPSASLQDKQLALRFIVHIVGDLHQPLHAGNGKDKGGNDVKVQFGGDETNLHSVWDSGLIDRQQLSYSEMANWLLADITPAQAKEWNTADPKVWIAESAKLRDTIYPEGNQVGGRYAFQHKADIDRRLSMGGVRIAAYLNDLFARRR